MWNGESTTCPPPPITAVPAGQVAVTVLTVVESRALVRVTVVRPGTAYPGAAVTSDAVPDRPTASTAVASQVIARLSLIRLSSLPGAPPVETLSPPGVGSLPETNRSSRQDGRSVRRGGHGSWRVPRDRRPGRWAAGRDAGRPGPPHRAGPIRRPAAAHLGHCGTRSGLSPATGTARSWISSLAAGPRGGAGTTHALHGTQDRCDACAPRVDPKGQR